MSHLKSDKPQTKLGILNMAVEVIMTLEQQVRGKRITLPLPQLSWLIALLFLLLLCEFCREKFEPKSCLSETKGRREGRRWSKNSTASFVAASSISSITGEFTLERYQQLVDDHLFCFIRNRDLRQIFHTILNNNILAFGDKQIYWSRMWKHLLNLMRNGEKSIYITTQAVATESASKVRAKRSLRKEKSFKHHQTRYS